MASKEQLDELMRHAVRSSGDLGNLSSLDLGSTIGR